MPVGCGVVQRSAVVLAGDVRIGASIEKVGDDLDVVADNSDLERSIAGAASGVDTYLVTSLELKLIFSEVSEKPVEACSGSIVWH